MKIYTHSKYTYVRVVEMPKSEIDKVDFAHCKEPKETLTAFYNRQTVKPDIVANLGFFSMSTGESCFNFVSNYKTVNKTSLYEWGMGVRGDANLEYNGLTWRKDWKCFVSGYPNLISGGKKVNIDFAQELNYNARRTMLGYNDTTVFLVLVESPGLAFTAMQNLMLELGCTYAINLDGGGSTKALHKGVAITKNVTNRPVDSVLAIYLKSEKTITTTTATTNKENKNGMLSCFRGRFKVTSPYGNRTINGKTDNHRGIDLVGIDDKAVRAPCDGIIGASAIVTNRSDSTWQWGNYVRLDTNDGHSIYMCHMDSRAVVAGQKVKAGDKLGIMGNTGYSFGAHTHLEVRKYGTNQVVNPSEYTGIPNKTGTYDTNNKTQSNNSDTIDVTYQAYANGKWWNKITNYNTDNTNGYAGVDKYPVQALKVDLSKGSVQYRAHTINGKWWSWITDSTGTGTNAYSGVIGRNIDAIQVRLVGDLAKTHSIRYRVSTNTTTGYLPWVDDDTDYAGIMGKPIDKIQMYVKKK